MLASGLAAHAQTATKTTLTVSNANPTYVTPPSGGFGTALNPVTVTATVSYAGSQPVEGGTVTFFDNALALTGGLTASVAAVPIATVNVQFSTSGNLNPTAGQAILHFAFGPGPHQLTAIFSGTSASAVAPGATPVSGFLPSTSGAVSLNSNGKAAQALGFQILGPSGTLAGYDEESAYGYGYYTYNTSYNPTMGEVYLFAFGLQSPAGVTNLYDQTTNTTYPLTNYITSGTPNGFRYSDYAPILTEAYSGKQPYGDYIYSLGVYGVTNFIVADFSQAGVPQLLTVSTGQNQIANIPLYSAGNAGSAGNETLIPVATMPVKAVAADVNGDGLLDIVLAHNDPNSPSTGVGILTNSVVTSGGASSSGNFVTPEAVYSVGHPVGNVAVGDLNGDGIADIVAVTADGTNLVMVLLNNGDGTYTPQPNGFAAGNGASQIALADFNKDGILDIAVLNIADNDVGVLLGNGDGTFQPMIANAVTPSPTAMAVADFNQDGVLDIAVSSTVGAQVAQLGILYGVNTAPGTFSLQALNQLYLTILNYPETQALITSMAVGDVNGDGYPDLVFGENINGSYVAIYNPTLNNGYGGYDLSQQAFFDEENGINVRTSSMIASDLDGDGLIDLLFMPTINNNLFAGGGESPDMNNLMVHFTGTNSSIWNGPAIVNAPLGNHNFYASYQPAANSIYTPEVQAGPIVFDIIPQPILTVTPTTLNFGPVPVTTTSSLTLSIGNAGSADLTNLTISSFYGNDSGFFTVTGTTCPTTIHVGDPNCTATISFAPQAYRQYNAFLAITYGSASTGYGVTLTGTGEVPGTYVNVNETIHLTDTVPAPAFATPVTVGEAIHLADSVTAATALAVGVNETIHLTDAVTAVNATAVAVDETIHLTDAVTAGQAGTPINVSETLHLTDTVGEQQVVIIQVKEGVSVTDTPVVSPAVVIQVKEGIGIQDVPSLTPGGTNSDTTTLTASPTAVAIGGTVQLAAAVKAAGSAQTPTGSVNFYDGSSLLATEPLGTGYSTSSLAAGTHNLQAVYQGDSNFKPSTSAVVQVTVTSMNILTVTPVNVSRNFEAATPTLTYGITGFVNGDTIAVVSGAPVLGTTAVPNSPAGSYPITGTVGTLSAPSNYVFSFVAGSLTVNGNAPETITFNPISPISLGAVQQLTLTAHSSSGGLGQPITYSVSGPATLNGNTLTLTGTGSVSVTASEAANTTFVAATSVTRTFTVTP